MKNIKYILALWAPEKLNRKIIKLYNNVLARQLMEQLLVLIVILLFSASTGKGYTVTSAFVCLNGIW